MTKSSPGRAERRLQRKEYDKLTRDLNEGLAETKALNRSMIEDITPRAFAFMDAVRDVDNLLSQFEILAAANGGDKTADCLVTIGDRLLSALSKLDRTIDSERSNPNPFLYMNIGELHQLAQFAQAARFIANEYKEAKQPRRADIQKQLKNALSGWNEIIASLYRDQTHSRQDMKAMAELIVFWRDEKGKTNYRDALIAIRHFNTPLYNRWWSDPPTAADLGYARILYKRYKDGLL